MDVTIPIRWWGIGIGGIVIVIFSRKIKLESFKKPFTDSDSSTPKAFSEVL